MILILAEQCEVNVNMVTEILDHYQASWFRLNGEDFPLQRRLHIELTPNGPEGILQDAEGRGAGLCDVRSVWSRRQGKPTLGSGLSPGQQELMRKECVYSLQGYYSLLAHASWMNDYWMESKAVNKIYQLNSARACGLIIPATLITQHPAAARRFCEQYDWKVICKVISQSGYVEGDETRLGKVIYANRLDESPHLDLDRVRRAPTLFQEYVEKQYELRVTIVGNKVFATALDSQASERSKVDWRRYDISNTPYYSYCLPHCVEQRLLLLMRCLGLEFGAVDLIRNRQGEYVFLEVNPGGQWGWVENMTGHPIYEAVARWLMERGGQDERITRIAVSACI